MDFVFKNKESATFTPLKPQYLLECNSDSVAIALLLRSDSPEKHNNDTNNFTKT